MNKKGVSPVIAVLLLVVITVAAAVLVYIWLVGFMQSQTAATGTTALGEKIKFEAVSLNSSSGTFTAYIRNIGETKVNITTAYLLKADGQTLIEKIDVNQEIDVGQLVQLTVSFTKDKVEADKVYVIKLVTSLGTEFTVKVKAT